MKIVPDEKRDEFWTAMRRDLPSSFRFTGSKGHALVVQRKFIEHYIPQLSTVVFEGNHIEPPKPLPWYPENLGWSLDTPKQVVRKDKAFAAFQKFLVSETSIGNVSRQEAVSMIPPLLMDLRPGMTVLDMCAAPGSKTAQLVEMVHGGEEARIRSKLREIRREQNLPASPDGQQTTLEDGSNGTHEDWSDDGRATGLIIANDADYRRSQLLVHQVKRLNSPNFIVTNHDAGLYPSIQIPSDSGRPRYLKFDRILADVPCTGDGTTRKNYTVWKEWTPANAIGLHPLQVRILVRALQMLKSGGRTVYSTCSLNPIEDEAVVAAAISQCGGPSKVRVIDCSRELPTLKRERGLTSWRVMDKKNRWWNTWAEVERKLDEQKIDPDGLTQLRATMFPPTDASEDGRIALENCIRIYPHLQDTGGFFITVLEKVADVTVPASEINTKADEPDAHEGNGETKVEAGQKRPRPAEGNVESSRPSKRGAGVYREEPFNYLDPEHEVLKTIYDFYQLHEQFPRDRFMVRNDMVQPSKSIYYTSALVRDILTLNAAKGMRFIQAGVKLFGKQDTQGRDDVCCWRIQSEGIHIVDPWVGESRVLRLYKRPTFQKLVREMFIKVGIDSYEALPEIGAVTRDLTMGCYVLRVESSEAEDGFR
jgi:multisite-specific tRNA:(cytosine-C5)-methyltransferase